MVSFLLFFFQKHNQFSILLWLRCVYLFELIGIELSLKKQKPYMIIINYVADTFIKCLSSFDSFHITIQKVKTDHYKL